MEEDWCIYREREPRVHETGNVVSKFHLGTCLFRGPIGHVTDR